MFPLVGLLLGGISVAVDHLLGAVDPGIRNVAILAVAALASGAIHYDGLADTLDSLGGATSEERLRIMRDGSIGTFAVLGLVFTVAAELAALSALAEDWRRPALVLAPIAGRTAMIWCAYDAPSARSDGLGAAFVRALASADVLVASTIAVVLLVVLGGARGTVAGLLVAAASFSLRWMATRRLGGVTGDVLGAAGKVSEMLLLVFFAAS